MRDRKPFDPALRQALGEAAALAVSCGVGEAQTDAELVGALRALSVAGLRCRAQIPGLPNAVDARDVALGAALRGRLYTPSGAAGPRPVLVYFHGGGWVMGSVETHDPFCRLFSEAAGCQLLSVDYRLAPEHRHPAAIEDALAAVAWAAAHAEQWGGEPRRLAIGGDSAGAQLAAVAANQLCGRADAPRLRAQLLLYPVADHPSAGHASYTENATGYGLEASRMRWFWEQYAPGGSPDDPALSPLRHPALPSLPPTFVATAEYDVLRDEGIAYADELRAAGVAVHHHHAPDMSHNYCVSPATVARLPQCQAALSAAAGWLRQVLGLG